jgi:hypothetical protein
LSGIVLNILIGLVTSVLSGGGVLVWRRARDAGLLRRKAAFFGFDRGTGCLIVLNDNWRLPYVTSHDDVRAVITAACLARELGCRGEIAAATALSEANGARLEFCIGGPVSNPRTKAYLASELPGVVFKPLTARRGSGAVVVGGSRFLFEAGRREHAVVAKFTPRGSARPVILVAGQTAIANRGAIQYLEGEHRALAKSLASSDLFCLILCVEDSHTQGCDATRLAADVTVTAFPAPRNAPAAVA